MPNTPHVQYPSTSPITDQKRIGANVDSEDRTATATATGPSPPPDVDPQILDALRSKDRIYVLDLGETFESLITHRRTRVELTPATSYQRVLVYRCAAYYKLAPENDHATNGIFVLSTADSRIPERRICELVPAAESTAQPAFKVMRRSESVQDHRSKPRSHAGSVAGEDGDLSLSDVIEPSESGSSSKKKRMTVEEREAAYNEARSRIFMNFEEREKSKEKDTSASSSSLSLDVKSKSRSESRDDLNSPSSSTSSYQQGPTEPTAPLDASGAVPFQSLGELEREDASSACVDSEFISAAELTSPLQTAQPLTMQHHILDIGEKLTDSEVDEFEIIREADRSAIPLEVNKLRLGGTDMVHDVFEQGSRRDSESDMVNTDEAEHFLVETTTCWIAAEHALQHARSRTSSVSAVFDRWHIPKSEYAIHAGFDESLIRSGVGYLEQIHVFLSGSESAEDVATSRHELLTELGRLFSPFPSVLFTESSSRYLPVFKDDGSVWEFDELVYCTAAKFSDGGASAKMPLVVISLAQTSSRADGPTDLQRGGSGNGEGEQNEKRRSEKGKGKERDRGDEDGAEHHRDSDDKDPDDDPEDPSGTQGGPVAEPGKISFEIGSKIYLPVIQDSDKSDFQTITMLGSLTVKTTPLALDERPRRFSERHVQFEGLVFQATQPTTGVAYKQFHVVVVIDSQQENARVISIKPKTTTDSDREEKQLTSMKRGRTRGATLALTLGATPHGFISGTAMAANEETVGTERKRYNSGITAYRADGIVRWGFNVDDANLQTLGVDMEDAVLPCASFEFVGDSNVPAPPPRCVVATIVSHWSINLLPATTTEPKRTWIHRLLGRLGSSSGTGTSTTDSETISYSNLFQIVALKVDTYNLKEPSHYKAKLEVRAGTSGPPEVKRLGEESVNVTPAVVDDLRKLSRFNLPTIANFKLSDNCIPILGNSARDTKSH